MCTFALKLFKTLSFVFECKRGCRREGEADYLGTIARRIYVQLLFALLFSLTHLYTFSDHANFGVHVKLFCAEYRVQIMYTFALEVRLFRSAQCGALSGRLYLSANLIISRMGHWLAPEKVSHMILRETHIVCYTMEYFECWMLSMLWWQLTSWNWVGNFFQNERHILQIVCLNPDQTAQFSKSS